MRKVCAELSKNRVKRRLAFPGKREKGRRHVFSVMQPAEKENGHILQDVASPKPVKKRVRQQKRVKLSKVGVMATLADSDQSTVAGVAGLDNQRLPLTLLLLGLKHINFFYFDTTTTHIIIMSEAYNAQGHD